MTVIFPTPWWQWLLLVFMTGICWAVGTTVGRAAVQGLAQTWVSRHSSSKEQ